MHYTEYLMRYDDGIRMAGSKICKLNYNAWKRLRLGDLLEYLFPAKNMLQRPDSFRAWTTSSLTQLTDLLWIWYIRSRTSYVLIKDSFVVYKNWCKDRDLELTKSRSSILILYLLNFSVTNAIVLTWPASIMTPMNWWRFLLNELLRSQLGMTTPGMDQVMDNLNFCRVSPWHNNGLFGSVNDEIPGKSGFGGKA